MSKSSKSQLEKDIAFCIAALQFSVVQLFECLRASEKLGCSVEYFCEEFIFDCEGDDEQLGRVHDDEHLNIAEFNALYWEN
jgi:hypothetical protein